MGNKRWTRVLALVMALVCTLTVVAAVEFDALDFNKDGKVTVWDLQKWLGQENYAAALKQVLGGKGDELNPVRYEGEGENAVPVYEIWSEMGLRNMAKNATEGYSFMLMADIDLGGKDWTPVAGFKGVFFGNDKTISNFKITQSVRAGKTSNDYNMGFFADTVNAHDVDSRTVISNLHLADVNITADANANYIGAIVGTNRGDIEDCTAVSVVTDQRTTLSKTVYVGTLAGRNATQNKLDEDGNKVLNNQGKPVSITLGTITGANEMVPELNKLNMAEESLDDSDLKTPAEIGDKVNSKMATIFPEVNSVEEYTAQKDQRVVGIAGFSLAGGNISTLRWQDITNSTELADPVLQQRRETVADEMYWMSTVPWTVATTDATDFGSYNELRYYVYNSNDRNWRDSIEYLENRYFAGQFWMDADGNGKSENYKGFYRGFPYNHGSSGREQFMEYMDKREDGVYVTGSQIPSTAFYFTESVMRNTVNTAYTALKGQANEYTVVYPQNAAGTGRDVLTTNFTHTINDKQVTEKIAIPEGMTGTLETAGTTQFGFNMYLGADCSSQASWAWRKVSAVVGDDFANMLNTDVMFPTYANGAYSVDTITKYGIKPVNGMTFEYPDGADLDVDGKAYETDDRSAVVSDFYEANKAYFWDTLALTSKGDLLMNYSPAGGHTRVALSDAIVIRNYKGVLDENRSYIYTAEQGGGGVDSDGVNHYFDVDMETATGWMSSCCVNRRMTFAKLTEGTLTTSYTTGDSDGDGVQDVYAYGKEFYTCYFPITCDALRDANSAAGKVNINMENGKVVSNFHIVSTTVNGTETFTRYREQTNHRHPVYEVDLSSVAVGTPVTVLLSDGNTYTLTR